MALLTEHPPFVLRGQAKKLWACREPEILFDGPRGTGKTRPMCEYIVRYAMANQGCRIAVVRKSRKSMSQSTLVTLELVLGMLYPKALTGCLRTHVQSYWIGTSEIIATGCDDEEKLRGMEVSLIWVDECTELTLNDWESIGNALRWPVAPWRTIIGTCNPDSDQHWMWLRFKDGRIKRIQSSHLDNPALPPDYLPRLARQTGVRRKRYFEGIWTAAVGQVLDDFDPNENVIDCPTKADGEFDYDALHISWYFASMDWGHAAAGCMGIWGVDLSNKIYEVAEIYFTKKLSGWWCDALADMNKRFRLAAVVCDPSRPDMIGEFNLRLGYHPEAPDAICFGANNKRATSLTGDLAGINLMCEMVSKRNDGGRALYFIRDNQPYGIDQDLRDAGMPCSTIEEIPSYVWAKTSDERWLKDQVDKNVPADHGLDQTRYACMFARYRDMSEPPHVPKDDPETYGALYGHNRMVKAIEVAHEDGLTIEEVLEEMGVEDD